MLSRQHSDTINKIVGLNPGFMGFLFAGPLSVCQLHIVPGRNSVTTCVFQDRSPGRTTRQVDGTVGVADEMVERDEARLVNRYFMMDGAGSCGKNIGSPYLSMPNRAIIFRVLGLVRNSTN